MYTAVIVDRDYGSVSIKNQEYIKAEYLKRGINLRMEHYLTDDEIIEGCKDADVILGTGNPPITAKVFKELQNLKAVQRFGIGVNSVDLKSATETNTIVMNMPGFCIDELANHAASLILSLTRNTSYYDRKIRVGEWPKATYYVPKSLDEMTLGLYGFGGSAKELYEIFKNGFKTRVISHDPYFPEESKIDYDVEFVSFDEMLEQSDILSMHAPLNDKTRHIFNKDTFEKMKSDAMIINIARGGLIDEGDLIEALKSGEIRFAGLDVFEQEPIDTNSELLRMDNVVLTSHSAFYGEKAQKTQINLAIELVGNMLATGSVPLKYVANKDVVEKIKNIDFI